MRSAVALAPEILYFVPLSIVTAIAPEDIILCATYGRGGVAPAHRFQLYVRCAGPCRARDGCRAAVFVGGASVAQGAV